MAPSQNEPTSPTRIFPAMAWLIFSRSNQPKLALTCSSRHKILPSLAPLLHACQSLTINFPLHVMKMHREDALKRKSYDGAKLVI